MRNAKLCFFKSFLVAGRRSLAGGLSLIFA